MDDNDSQQTDDATMMVICNDTQQTKQQIAHPITQQKQTRRQDGRQVRRFTNDGRVSVEQSDA